MHNLKLLQWFAAFGAVTLAGCVTPEPVEEPIATAQQALDVVGICNQDPRVNLNMVPLSVCAGARLFFDETFAGNGRSCGSCHPAANNFTIDAPFVAGLHATQPLNPLFVNENPAFNLGPLEEPFLLQQNALVEENVDDDFQDLRAHRASGRSVASPGERSVHGSDGAGQLHHQREPPERRQWSPSGSAPGSR